METAEIFQFIMTNLTYVVGGLGIAVAIMFIVIITLYMNLSHLKSRYQEMMTGEQTGKDFEAMLLDHIAKTDQALKENELLREDNRKIKALLQTALTRVGVVRFRAFEDMGSDLSYAVALLDSDNNGVVFSSIFGREDSRSYVKPLENARCERYTLSKEEEEAIKQALAKAVNK